MIEISDLDTGSTHLLALGEEIRVRLTENPTTGYRWHFTQFGRGTLRLMEDRFEPGDAAAPGAAGHRVVRFAGEKGGALTLEALERRAWQSADANSKKRVYAILIR